MSSIGFRNLLKSSQTIPILLVLVLALTNVVIKLAFFDTGFSNDAYEYTQTAAWMNGDAEAPNPSRLLKPLGPLAIAIFSTVLDINLRTAMELQAYVMYLFLAIAAYFLCFSFTQSRLLGFVGGAIIFSGYPLLNYGLDNYLETGAHTFYLLGLLGAWKYFQTPTTKTLLVTTATISMGILWKEYAILAGALLFLVVIFHPRLAVWEKARHLLFAGLVGGAVLLPWMIYVYRVYDYSYLAWYGIGTKLVGTAADERTFGNIMKSAFAVLLLAWPLVPLGIIRWRSIPTDRLKFLLLLIPPSLMFFLWGYVSSRLFYVVAPLLVLIGLHAIHIYAKGDRLRCGIILAIILFGNYLWLFINPIFREFLFSFSAPLT